MLRRMTWEQSSKKEKIVGENVVLAVPDCRVISSKRLVWPLPVSCSLRVAVGTIRIGAEVRANRGGCLRPPTPPPPFFFPSFRAAKAESAIPFRPDSNRKAF